MERKKKRMNSKKQWKENIGKHSHRLKPKAKTMKTPNSPGPVGQPTKAGHKAKTKGEVNTSGRTFRMCADSTRMVSASLERIVERSIRKYAKSSGSMALSDTILEGVMGTAGSYTRMHAENPSEAKSAHVQSAGFSISREQKAQVCRKDGRRTPKHQRRK